jgi:hypothetical protein
MELKCCDNYFVRGKVGFYVKFKRNGWKMRKFLELNKCHVGERRR